MIDVTVPNETDFMQGWLLVSWLTSPTFCKRVLKVFASRLEILGGPALDGHHCAAIHKNHDAVHRFPRVATVDSLGFNELFTRPGARTMPPAVILRFPHSGVERTKNRKYHLGHEERHGMGHEEHHG